MVPVPVSAREKAAHYRGLVIVARYSRRLAQSRLRRAKREGYPAVELVELYEEYFVAALTTRSHRDTAEHFLEKCS